MSGQFERSERIIGKEAQQKLSKATVAVFGLGGVGSYAAEALARSGIGTLWLIDNDTIALSNLNRQLIALHSTLNQSKVIVMKNRILDINPQALVIEKNLFFNEQTAQQIDFKSLSFIVDAIDTIASKILLVQKAKEFGIPIISSMGTGNKIHPERFEISDISKTSVCPLARVMRQELKKRNIQHLSVVYSKEEPIKTAADAESNQRFPGSMAFVPPAAGLLLSSYVVQNIIAKKPF